MFDTDWAAVLTILGMAGVTVLTRCFFFISDRPWSLPRWAERGLQYAPIAALSAAIAPEILMSHGAWIQTWQDARVFGTAAGMAWFFWRRGVFGTILCGMAVYLPLHTVWGW